LALNLAAIRRTEEVFQRFSSEILLADLSKRTSVSGIAWHRCQRRWRLKFEEYSHKVDPALDAIIRATKKAVD
jgi:hypothetical protein